MSEKRRGPHDGESSDDNPPFSRLFIICNRYHTEEDFREQFSKYGCIEDVWFVKDRSSGEKKGIAYIKYSKTSEAAKALEAMNGKVIGNTPRPIKVMIASNRCEGPVRDHSDGEKYVRLFVMIPKSMSDAELNEEFCKFGKIESANVIRDRETRESKGYGYVRYKYFSDAAKAYENADRKYKAIFAEPKRHKSAYESNYEHFSRLSGVSHSSNPSVIGQSSSSDEYTTLSVTCNPVCQQGHIWKLFDIVPGLEYCNYKVDERRRIGTARVTYANHLSAKYAKEKLQGFEYPPGSRLNIKPEYDKQNFSGSRTPPDFSSVGSNAIIPDVQNSVAQLAETIAHATSLIQAAAAGTLARTTSDDSFCNVKLPSVQPLANVDSPVAERCFLVCQPHPPPIGVLRDVFSRFGDLIDVYTLPHKNVGFVKYASSRAAQEARKVLHGAEVCGVRIKVLEAEEPRANSGNDHNEDYDDRRKRLKMDERSQ